jgi:hypothetical protein
MESRDSGATIFELSEVELPVFRIGTGVRFDENLSQLRHICEDALPTKGSNVEPMKYYFWDASNRWYVAVNIVKVRKAAFWLRFLGPSDLMIANYQLRLLPERPKEWKRAYAHMLAVTEYPPDKKFEARASLSKCDTSEKLICWMKKYWTNRPTRGY